MVSDKEIEKKLNRKGLKLSKKQKGFVRDIVRGETGTQSAINNYNIGSKGGKTTESSIINTANVIAVENLQKPTIQNAIKSIAEQIPDSLLVEKHLELLNKKDILTGLDTQAVKAGLDMAYKLKGNYAPEKTESKVVIETISEEQKKALLKLLK